MRARTSSFAVLASARATATATSKSATSAVSLCWRPTSPRKRFLQSLLTPAISFSLAALTAATASLEACFSLGGGGGGEVVETGSSIPPAGGQQQLTLEASVAWPQVGLLALPLFRRALECGHSWTPKPHAGVTPFHEEAKGEDGAPLHGKGHHQNVETSFWGSRKVLRVSEYPQLALHGET
jgi:hypothetical protein